jgi:asparagine synthase (glutamine-hydrolysing)
VSGFAAIFHRDGTPVEPSILRKLAASLAFRGPDAQQVWSSGPLGLVHALLRTSREARNERQPFSLDGNTWIVADARVDARKDLSSALRCESGFHAGVSSDAPDVELILRAYLVWGEACVQRLLGDFAFVIWDASQRRLFAARDHFGVKPLFYADTPGALLISNTLDCLRRHPAVSDALHDLAIADFLLFDTIQDPAATSFQDIRRLPPAHTLTAHDGQISVRRYWDLPMPSPVRYRHGAEYVQHFRELLGVAVADRLRSDSAAVLMSGGLDSPTVAASAKSVLRRAGNSNGLRAYTEVFDRLIPHEERHYATLVAEKLRIPIECRTGDDARIFQHAGTHSPEPVHSAWPDSTREQLGQISVHSRVALTGFGGDPLLSSLLSVHFQQLLSKKHFGRALADVARYFATEGRLSRLYIRKRFRRWFPPETESPAYPAWLNEDLERRLGLRDRWESLSRGVPAGQMARSVAHQQTLAGSWTSLFETFDPGITGVPVEVFHPFFDLRVVAFLLALPTVPWCCDKELLRAAARGVLPDAVRLRRKSPLPADPLVALLRKTDSAWVDQFEAVPELKRYLVRERIPKAFGTSDIWSSWIHLRPLSLNFWLSKCRPLGRESEPANTKPDVS